MDTAAAVSQDLTTVPPDDHRPVVRRAVAGVLRSTPAFLQLPTADQSRLALAMVEVCERAASLVKEEVESERALAKQRQRAPILAAGLSAGEQFSGVSASRVAGTTRAVLNAVSFPRFVNELITGVFKAILDSNAQQLTSFLELLQNVSASSEGFADTNLGPARARSWLVEQFPGSYTVDGGDEGEPVDPEDPESEPQLRLAPGASPPSEAALRTALGLGEGESIPSGDPERTLVPLARRALARQRQAMLSTMVLLGLQRIVIDAGRINASMRFHIDTRSAATDDRGSTFDTRTTTGGSGSFGAGPWGVSASLQTTIGFVTTQRSQSTEEMNTDLDLNSSVELAFRTDQVPLDRLATRGQVSAIRGHSVNPEAEAAADAGRLESARKAEAARRSTLDTVLRPPPVVEPPKEGPGSVPHAEAARERGNAAAAKEGGAAGAAGAGAGATGSGASAGKQAGARAGGGGAVAGASGGSGAR
jgi:hypothetical protein